MTEQNNWTFDYKGYKLFYYYRPGLWASTELLQEIENKLKIVNKESNKNFSYGIFDPKNKKDFYDNSMICVLEFDNHPAGFFYNVILDFKEDKKIVHQGLVLISKNIGENLLYFPYIKSNLIIHEKLNSFYMSSISSVPSIIGGISRTFDKVWPSPFEEMVVPVSKEYSQIAEKVFLDYVKKYFPFSEEVFFNKRRFIIESKAKEMGFEREIRNLSRYPKLEVNLFCQYWINYEKNEDLLQIGYYDESTSNRNKKLLEKL